MAQIYEVQNIRLPKLKIMKLPKITKLVTIKIKSKDSLSRSEKFRLLCPLWYEVLTTKDLFQRFSIKSENELSYTNPARCVMGEAYGFQSGLENNSYWWRGCSICDKIGNDFCDLTYRKCMSNEALNRNRQVGKFINHMERYHPDIIGDKWNINN